MTRYHKPDRSITDQLLKQGGVDFDIAWAFATGGNRQKFFQPSERDDGTQKPGDGTKRLSARGEEGEPFKRFQYRTHRAAYLDLDSRGARSLEDVRDLSDRGTLGRPRHRGTGAVAA